MKKKKITALICTAALMAGCLAGCGKGDGGNAVQADADKGTAAGTQDSVSNEGAAGDISEHVNISIGGINVGNSSSSDGWPTEIVTYIEDKFNVTLETKSYDNESLNLDLSGGTTCDILQINDEHIESILKGRHAVDLSQYQDSLAANIFSDTYSLRNEVLKSFKSNGEDKLYFVTPRVTSENARSTYGATLNYGYVVRWDLYKEIGCPEIKNDDDYVDALVRMKEIYPETEDGLPVYALSAYNDSNLHPYFFIGCLTQGYSNMESGLYVKNMATNELIPDIYDENLDGITTPFWAGMSFYNKLYNANLLDPDCFITKGEDLTEKYTKGQYLGGYVNWHFGNYNKNARAADPETEKQYVILPTYMGWANERNYAGWQGKYFLVSSHSKNVERAVMILDFLQSEECSRIVDCGIDGRWETTADGTPSLTEDTIDMKSNPARAEEWTKSGIGSTFSDMVGYDSNNIASDGGAISLWEQQDIMVRNLTAAEKDMCAAFDIELPSDLLKKKVEAGESMDLRAGNSAIQFGMEIVPSDIGRIDSNCEQITINAIPGLVQAKTEEEFLAAKEALMAELKAAGAEDSIAWWTQAWNTAKEAVEKMQ